jgi:organic radical activating enzyme
MSLVEKVVEVSNGMKGIDCVLTGGEPFLQASGDLCYELGKAGFTITLETNASVDFTAKAETLFNVNNVIYNCDYIVSSPKNKDYSRWILRNSSCLKLVYPLDFYSDKNVLFDMVSSVEHNSSKRHVDLVLQPMTGFKKEGFSEEESFSEICRDAMAFAQDRYKKFGEAWRIIPQAHVFMGLD